MRCLKMHTQKKDREKLLNLIKDGVMLVSPTGHVTFINQAAERLLEKTATTIQEQNISIIHPELGVAIQNVLTEGISTVTLISLEHAQILCNIHTGLSAAEWAAKRELQLEGLLIVEMEDVTEYIYHPQLSTEAQNPAKNELHSLIYRDYLTKALNRRFFDMTMPEVLNLATLQGKPVSLSIIDIDNFKTINDTYGHQAGDTVLQMVVTCLKNNSRKDDMVFRLGGDEFALVLVNTSLKIALERAEKMRKDIMEQNPGGEKPITPITISAGIASFPEQALTLEQLYRHADLALYQAKAQGRNCVRVYNGAIQI